MIKNFKGNKMKFILIFLLTLHGLDICALKAQTPLPIIMTTNFTLQYGAEFPVMKLIFPDAKTYSFIVDTGSTSSFIDRDSAQNMKLGITKYQPANSTDEYIKPHVRIGIGYPGLGIPMLLTNLSAMRNQYPEISGILGMNFLEFFKVRINFENRKIDFISVPDLHGTDFEPKTAIAINMKKSESHQFSVEGKISNEKLDFIIDTGTGITFIDDPRSASQILYKSSLSGYRAGIYSALKSAIVMVECKYVRIENINLKGLNWMSPIVRITKTDDKTKFNGLGIDFLKRYNVLFDFENKKIFLTPNYKFQDNSIEWVGLGINYEIENGQLHVETVAYPSPASDAKVQVNDIILAIDGVSLKGKIDSEVKDLLSFVKAKKVGEEVTFKIKSNKQNKEYTVKLKVKKLL